MKQSNNLLSQRLTQSVKRSNKTRFVVGERIETVFSMIGTHSTVSDASERQFFNCHKNTIVTFRTYYYLQKRIQLTNHHAYINRITLGPRDSAHFWEVTWNGNWMCSRQIVKYSFDRIFDGTNMFYVLVLVLKVNLNAIQLVTIRGGDFRSSLT